ncbi:hypothetical protein A2U01_0040182, partial [Trifolium medium]|nr:hypothetical protein [Trifolium medium]
MLLSRPTPPPRNIRDHVLLLDILEYSIRTRVMWNVPLTMSPDIISRMWHNVDDKSDALSSSVEASYCTITSNSPALGGLLLGMHLNESKPDPSTGPTVVQFDLEWSWEMRGMRMMRN